MSLGRYEFEAAWDVAHPHCEECGERGCLDDCDAYKRLVVPISELAFNSPALVHVGECLRSWERKEKAAS